MPFCVSCGLEMPEGKRFCTRCGSANEEESLDIGTHSTSKVFSVVAGAILLALLAFALIVIWKSPVWQSPEEMAARKQAEARAVAQEQAEEEAHRIRELLGDELPCTTHTATSDVYNYFNPSIEGAKTFINRNNGTVTIMFNFNTDFRATFPFPSNFQNRPVMPLRRFLVRVFDQNGQYLTHFITAERFSAPDRFAELDEQQKARFKARKLEREGNTLQYTINMRDAEYAASVEFGFSD